MEHLLNSDFPLGETYPELASQDGGTERSQ